MAQGGYRAPSNPAPVSGPGALSQRTDGGPADKQATRRLPNAGYGESKDFESIQGGAPMAEAPSVPRQFTGIGLGEPSGRPDEPVTAGADAGAGPGSEALGIPNEDTADLQSLVAYLPVLEFMANRPNAHSSTRALVRRLKSML